MIFSWANHISNPKIKVQIRTNFFRGKVEKKKFANILQLEIFGKKDNIQTLINVPNYDKQNYFFCRIKLLVKKFGHFYKFRTYRSTQIFGPRIR